jgi:hypothetical protein
LASSSPRGCNLARAESAEWCPTASSLPPPTSPPSSDEAHTCGGPCPREGDGHQSRTPRRHVPCVGAGLTYVCRRPPHSLADRGPRTPRSSTSADCRNDRGCREHRRRRLAARWLGHGPSSARSPGAMKISTGLRGSLMRQRSLPSSCVAATSHCRGRLKINSSTLSRGSSTSVSPCWTRTRLAGSLSPAGPGKVNRGRKQAWFTRSWAGLAPYGAQSSTLTPDRDQENDADLGSWSTASAEGRRRQRSAGARVRAEQSQVTPEVDPQRSENTRLRGGRRRHLIPEGDWATTLSKRSRRRSASGDKSAARAECRRRLQAPRGRRSGPAPGRTDSPVGWGLLRRLR